MTTSLLELRRMPETCGRGEFTAVVSKSALILPCLAVAPGLAVACYAIGFPRRTS